MAATAFSKGVLLKGLPFSVTEEEIKTFFKSLMLADDCIHLIKYRDGKGTGLAFVKLKDEEEIKHALLMDKNHIGSRYVEVVRSDESEMHHLTLQARSGGLPSDLYRMSSGGKSSRSARDRSPVHKSLNTRFCYIQGLPPGKMYKDVRRFFKGLLIGRNCINLMKSPDGSFRGDGYIEFSDSGECMKGLEMNGKMLEGSVIRVEACAESEVQHIRDKLERNQETRDVYYRDRRNRRDRTPSPVRRRRDTYRATYGRDTLYRDGDEYYGEYDDHLGHYGADIRTTLSSSSYVNPYFHASARQQDPYGYTRHVQHSDYSTEGYTTAAYASLHGMPRQAERSYVSQARGFYDTRSAPTQVSHISPQVRGSYEGRGTFDSRSGYTEDISQLRLAPLPSVAAESSILPREQRMVRMEGLSYNISVQEILAFFRGYGLSYESVRIQCRDDGSPSGKAFVTFPSEKYAHVAVHDLDRRYLGDRMVELFLV